MPGVKCIIVCGGFDCAALHVYGLVTQEHSRRMSTVDQGLFLGVDGGGTKVCTALQPCTQKRCRSLCMVYENVCVAIYDIQKHHACAPSCRSRVCSARLTPLVR